MNRSIFAHPAILLLLIIAIYSPLIGNSTFSPDAHIILPPLFESTMAGYFGMLFNFEVVDFQPVRDLSFFIDIFFFKKFQLITFSFSNILIWWLACVQIYFLAKRTSEHLSHNVLLLLVLAFASYPLFSQVVGWTMARKHLMAFCLILFTTQMFLDWMEGKRKWFIAYLAYVCAVLSHPIVTLWPCWALIHFLLMKNNHKRSENYSIFGFFFITMLALLLTNYAYYSVLSPRLLEYYLQTKPKISFSRVLLHFGSYWRQLAWPYRMTFSYFPDVMWSLPGWIMFSVIIVFAWVMRRKKIVLSWLAFALFPFPVFIGISVYDQYLLVTATGIFLALISVLKIPEKPFAIALIISICFWSCLTFNEARLWPQRGAISERNFESFPSCRSAIAAMNSISQVRKGMPEDILNYFEKYKCHSVISKLPPAEKPKALVAHSIYLFYRKDKLGTNTVSEILHTMGKAHYFPLLLYALMKSEENSPDDVKASTDFIYERTNGPLDDIGPLVSELLPFCIQNKILSCQKILNKSSGDKFPFF